MRSQNMYLRKINSPLQPEEKTLKINPTKHTPYPVTNHFTLPDIYDESTKRKDKVSNYDIHVYFH